MYTQVCAGGFRTVLLRSDGHALACGEKLSGACDIVPPEPGNSYCHVGENLPLCDLVLQVEFLREDDTVTFICSTLAGKDILCLNARGFDLALDIHNAIARKLNASSLQVLLPDGQLLGSICRAHPLVTVADVEQGQRPA
jgi:hypothetical protein